jgi:hypothetical protein
MWLFEVVAVLARARPGASCVRSVWGAAGASLFRKYGELGRSLGVCISPRAFIPIIVSNGVLPLVIPSEKKAVF